MPYLGAYGELIAHLLHAARTGQARQIAIAGSVDSPRSGKNTSTGTAMQAALRRHRWVRSGVITAEHHPYIAGVDGVATTFTPRTWSSASATACIVSMSPSSSAASNARTSAASNPSNSAAGVRLSTSQSAMSGSLARLRRHFNDELLIRVGREYELTPLAERLLPVVQASLHKAEEALSLTRHFDPARSRQRFSVVMSDYVMTVLVEPLLRVIASEAPGVRIDFHPIVDGQLETETHLRCHDLMICCLISNATDIARSVCSMKRSWKRRNRRSATCAPRSGQSACCTAICITTTCC